MSKSRFVLAGCLVLGLAASGLGQDKDKKADEKAVNKEKIVGIWEVAKSDSAPPGATIEFTKDGKLKTVAKVGDKTVTAEGSYKIDGDKLMSVMKVGDKEKEIKETVTIKTLTDKALVILDEKGKTNEFKRK